MTKRTKKTLYFGYGSNLWKDQMKRRCPESRVIGVGELKGWQWIINCRGYANIIPSPDHVVHGLLYELTVNDEKELDRFEGLGRPGRGAYQKEWHKVDFLSLKNSDVQGRSSKSVMTYIDVTRLEEGKPLEEYIHRMNKGIDDGIEEGISQEYFELNLRRFIPPATSPVADEIVLMHDLVVSRDI